MVASRMAADWMATNLSNGYILSQFSFFLLLLYQHNQFVKIFDRF